MLCLVAHEYLTVHPNIKFSNDATFIVLVMYSIWGEIKLLSEFIGETKWAYNDRSYWLLAQYSLLECKDCHLHYKSSMDRSH